jgi:hypothetical protein
MVANLPQQIQFRGRWNGWVSFFSSLPCGRVKPIIPAFFQNPVCWLCVHLAETLPFLLANSFANAHMQNHSEIASSCGKL